MKISWNYLKSLNCCPIPTNIETRTPSQHKKYLDFLQELKHKNISASKNIYNLYFKNNEPHIFIPNNFPYNVDDNIVHYLLWFNPTKIVDINKIKEIIKSYIPDKEFVFFENYNSMKSIKDMFHIHVFFQINSSLK